MPHPSRLFDPSRPGTCTLVQFRISAQSCIVSDESSEEKETKMSAFRFHSSRPHEWESPRPYRDAYHRRMKYGRIQPMDRDRPGLFERLFGLR